MDFPLSPRETLTSLEDIAMVIKKFLLLLMAFAVVVAPAGCIFSPDEDDPDDGGGGGTVGQPFPSTEEILMDNFKLSYEDMDFNSFRDLLHPDYIFLLQSSTTEEFPDVGDQFSREEEIDIARRMFTGDPVTDPDGNLVPGISTISFDTFEQQGDWATSLPNDVIPNSSFALFEVTFNFDRAGHSTLRVMGQIKFYVTSRDSLHNGATRQYWQLRGQQDLTNN